MEYIKEKPCLNNDVFHLLKDKRDVKVRSTILLQ